MKSSQFEQFIKLMQLSASDSDAEALGALRRATRVMQEAGFTWEMLLRRQVTVIAEVEAVDEGSNDIPLRDQRRNVDRSLDSRSGLEGAVEGPREELDEGDFDLAIRGARGEFLGVLESIYDQWQEGRLLSARQVQVVRNAAERAAERHPGGRR